MIEFLCKQRLWELGQATLNDESLLEIIQQPYAELDAATTNACENLEYRELLKSWFK